MFRPARLSAWSALLVQEKALWSAVWICWSVPHRAVWKWMVWIWPRWMHRHSRWHAVISAWFSSILICCHHVLSLTTWHCHWNWPTGPKKRSPPGLPNYWNWSAWVTVPRRIRLSFPVVRNSVWLLPGPWVRRRKCCCVMKRHRRSIRKPPSQFWRCWKRSIRNWALPFCWSLMKWRW